MPDNKKSQTQSSFFHVYRRLAAQGRVHQESSLDYRDTGRNSLIAQDA
jgi:hypothetical protein